MDTIAQPIQVFSLRDLLSSTLVATVDADTATAHRYFNNMCELAFESFNAQTNEARSLRMFTFQYLGADGTMQSLNVPVLSLVPLPLLQVKEACFDFDVRLVDLIEPEAEEFFVLEDAGSTPDGSLPGTFPQLRVTLQPFSQTNNAEGRSTASYAPNMKVNIKLQQADVPGGLSKFLQVVNNLDLKQTSTN